MKRITLKYLKETLLELDPTLERANYNTALVLLAGLTCGPDLGSLAELTKLPFDFIARIRQRMVVAELWNEVDVCCDHWFNPDGSFYALAFWVDLLVAQGLVVRMWLEEEGQYGYQISRFVRQAMTN